MNLQIPDLKGKDLFKFLIDNEKTLVAQKKFELKRADPIYYAGPLETDKGRTVKAGLGVSLQDKDELQVTSIINTTYWYDSHGDVHVNGLWKKSLSENKGLYLLQEHKMEFEKIIADPDDVRAYTKEISWASLGVDFPGFTEALVFESKVKRDRNSYMHGQYGKGHVKNHSVGMRYVTIDLALNDEDYPAYKSLWDKYIDKIANRADVEDAGYFWPVTQAKAIEGSAVPMGSNRITPTESVKNISPSADTKQRAAKSTRLDALNNLLTLTKNVK